MANNYQGPPEDFALVIPVPVVLQKPQVKTLPPEVFDRIDQLTAPRLVEYWEQDPCRIDPPMNMMVPGAMRRTGGGRPETTTAVQPQVVIEAQFEVGEYEIVILSASDSGALDRR